MTSIYKNLHTERQYKASTGLGKSEFDVLAELFEKYYVARQSNPYPNTPQPVLTDAREALFFILHYLKSYPTLENMGLYFGFDVHTVSNYIKYTKPYLKLALQESGSLSATVFKNQEDFDRTFQGIEDIMIDATEISIEKPKDNNFQAKNYSGKKKCIP